MNRRSEQGWVRCWTASEFLIALALAACGEALIPRANAADEGAFRALVHHHQFEDFARGTFEDGGSNLYVTRSGKMQMIHRWDLNNDGFLDIFVGQDHDHIENVDALIYWGKKDGPQSILPDVPKQQPMARWLREVAARERNATHLPSDGGGRSLLADLNGDGFLEVVFCNYIHNYSVDMHALIYWGGAGGYSLAKRTELPTLMAQGVAAADFNHDGFVDLAFANSGIEGGERFGFSQHRESYLYWNGPTGLSAAHRTSIPTISAVACAAGELTGDNYPELIFLNNNSEQKSVYIYFGDRDGFAERRREVRMGGDPLGVHLADLTGDGLLELVLMHRDNRAEIFRGAADGLESEPWTQLETRGAVECRSADLNQDGNADLVFANRTDNESFVYWGSPDGFSPTQRLELPTLHANDVALADFNGDGWIDLAFANEHDEATHDVNSYIYWNGPRGFHAANRRDVQGFGAVSVQAADLDADDHPEVVLVNRISGANGAIDSFIYWGNAHHRYSPASMSLLRAKGQGVVGIADLNQDGWVDVAFPEGTIYWGNALGFGPDRRSEIADMEDGHGISVADLNRDGYLDLVTPRKRASNQGEPSIGTILWGGKNGYDSKQRTELKVDAHFCQSVTIADVNRDGELDLIFPDADTDYLEIFFGSPNGYGPATRQKLRIHSAGPIETADLNGDGWLDLIMGGTYDQDKFGKPSRILSLLWGGPLGYSTARSVQLDGFESEEQVVADFNRDGILDIATTNYHAYTTRSLPFYIYWGAEGAKYSEENRSSYPAESSSALSAADFNQDGWIDLAVFSHLERGDHGTGAHLYWGGPDGFSVARRDWLPTFGPHYSVRRDIGNLHDRRLEERYVSEAIPWPSDGSVGRLRWTAETPHGTGVRFQLRSAPTSDELSQTKWHGVDGAEASWYEKPGQEFTLPSSHGWIQYRAVLTTPNGGSTPVLEEVTLEVKP